MRLILAFAASAALMFGCTSPVENDEAGASNDALTADANRNFHPKNECFQNLDDTAYTAEIDLSDRAHPRYRIRHQVDVDVRGKQNINLRLRDGSTWKSDDNLVSRRSSLDLENMDPDDGEVVLRRIDDASARDPWDPLPVPKEFLDKAFEVTKDGVYNLQSWEVIVNIPWITLQGDPICRQAFYATP